MPVFGKSSLRAKATCHIKLQEIMDEAIKEYDFSVLQGHRTRAQHKRYLVAGTTRVPYSKTKHRFLPSRAVDIAPYPIDWNNIERFMELGNVMMRIAGEKGIDLRWGGRWRNFKDYPHFELGTDE